MRTRMVATLVVAGALVAVCGGAATADPPKRELTWTCTDGTTFAAARPDFAAAASPVVGTNQVWIQMETLITRPDGTTSSQTWGGDAPGVLGSSVLLTCETMSGLNHVLVTGLLVGPG